MLVFDGCKKNVAPLSLDRGGTCVDTQEIISRLHCTGAKIYTGGINFWAQGAPGPAALRRSYNQRAYKYRKFPWVYLVPASSPIIVASSKWAVTG